MRTLPAVLRITALGLTRARRNETGQNWQCSEKAPGSVIYQVGARSLPVSSCFRHSCFCLAATEGVFLCISSRCHQTHLSNHCHWTQVACDLSTFFDETFFKNVYLPLHHGTGAAAVQGAAKPPPNGTKVDPTPGPPFPSPCPSFHGSPPLSHPCRCPTCGWQHAWRVQLVRKEGRDMSS